MLNVEKILEVLRPVQDPELRKSLVELNMIRQVTINDGVVKFTLVLTTIACPLKEFIVDECKTVVKKLPGVTDVEIEVTAETPQQKSVPDRMGIDGVRNIIAISSGKGGVGKSTISANVAVALAKMGAKVGLIDADIYGPSQPMMLGITGRPESLAENTIEPMEGHGLQASSIGFLIEQDNPMVWRGPMVTSALEQLLRQTRWRDLDYLIVDMPPGTGDIQLTLSQKVPVTGSVIVTTPQDIALLDARKGLKMFEKVGIPIIGIIENMSTYVCPKCNHEEHIFGEGGGKKMCQDYGVDFLGALPLNLSIREQADSGRPTVVADPDGAISAIYKGIARQVAIRIANLSKDMTSKFPSIVVQKT